MDQIVKRRLLTGRAIVTLSGLAVPVLASPAPETPPKTFGALSDQYQALLTALQCARTALSPRHDDEGMVALPRAPDPCAKLDKTGALDYGASLVTGHTAPYFREAVGHVMLEAHRCGEGFSWLAETPTGLLDDPQGSLGTQLATERAPHPEGLWMWGERLTLDEYYRSSADVARQGAFYYTAAQSADWALPCYVRHVVEDLTVEQGKAVATALYSAGIRESEIDDAAADEGLSEDWKKLKPDLYHAHEYGQQPPFYQSSSPDTTRSKPAAGEGGANAHGGTSARPDPNAVGTAPAPTDKPRLKDGKPEQAQPTSPAPISDDPPEEDPRKGSRKDTAAPPVTHGTARGDVSRFELAIEAGTHPSGLPAHEGVGGRGVLSLRMDLASSEGFLLAPTGELSVGGGGFGGDDDVVRGKFLDLGGSGGLQVAGLIPMGPRWRLFLGGGVLLEGRLADPGDNLVSALDIYCSPVAHADDCGTEWPRDGFVFVAPRFDALFGVRAPATDDGTVSVLGVLSCAGYTAATSPTAVLALDSCASDHVSLGMRVGWAPASADAAR